MKYKCIVTPIYQTPYNWQLVCYNVWEPFRPLSHLQHFRNLETEKIWPGQEFFSCSSVVLQNIQDDNPRNSLRKLGQGIFTTEEKENEHRALWECLFERHQKDVELICIVCKTYQSFSLFCCNKIKRLCNLMGF